MKIGICDDQTIEAEIIKKYCQNLGYENIYLYTSGEDLLNSPELSSINLLFLDIKMRGISGIEVKNKLEQTNSSILIVFCTTHKELMQNAFGRNVISFLNKPCSRYSIEHCIKKAAHLTKEFYPVNISKTVAIPCGDIIYLHAEQKYTIFYTRKGETYSTRKPMKEWAMELDKFGFCPISRSSIINLKYYIKTQEKQILLCDNISLPVSRRYLPILKEKMLSISFDR